MLPVRLSGHEREIQHLEAQTCTSAGLQRRVHAAGQVHERTRQVERPAWEACDTREQEVEIGSYVIYRFVVILQHKTERPTSKQMVKQTHFRFVYLFCCHN